MGIALLVTMGCTFLLGGAIAFLSFTGWQTALRLELGLVVFATLLSMAWGLRRTWRRQAWPEDGWAVLIGVLALGAVGCTFVLGEGPGVIAPVLDRSIDLRGWWLSSGGVAAAVIAMIFGALATRRPRLLQASSGALICGIGLLALQPAFAAAGWPTVGPLGLLVASAALVGYRFTRPSSAG